MPLELYTEPLGTRLAAHLLRRTSYHVTKDRIDLLATMTPAQAVNDLFDIRPLTREEPLDHVSMDTYINSGSSLEMPPAYGRRNIYSWWCEEAVQDESIGHKLQFFLHSIFVTNLIHAGGQAGRAFDYLALLRLCSTRYVSGDLEMDSYKELAYKMTTDNLMLLYLNGHTNLDNSPNENYAREFLELFTIGRGEQVADGDYTNYTEADILEAARLLTGWRSRTRPSGQPGNPDYMDTETGLQTGDAVFSNHDSGSKQFSAAFDDMVIEGASNEEEMWSELREFVEMVFAQSETAKTICRRIYRYFCHDNITAEVESSIITPMANTLRNHDYKISIAIKRLLRSKDFYDLADGNPDDNIIGGLIKSPLELLLGSMSFFNIQRPDIETDALNHYWRWWYRTVQSRVFIEGGMDLFRPPSVAGYGAYHQAPTYSKNWFSGAALVARYKQPEILISGQSILATGHNGGVQLNIVDFVANSGVFSEPADGATLVSEMLDYLFSVPVDQGRFDYFLDVVFLDGLSLINWSIEWQNYLDTGDESSVCIPLKALFVTVLSSQEYGCM